MSSLGARVVPEKSQKPPNRKKRKQKTTPKLVLYRRKTRSTNFKEDGFYKFKNMLNRCVESQLKGALDIQKPR
ncbi:unnamed protein product, partial [Plutella xylostella]